jgi:NAD(P)-dependent dehydrogenase (short-subunit alcohol dehydrogenase family)
MIARGLIDTVLDRSVVGGYSSLGYRLRQPTWDSGDLAAMDGRVVLVTGATSGIGRAAAEGFAELGASVRILARDRRRGEQARDEIAARSGNRDVGVELCDLSNLAAVRGFAERFSAQAPRLDVLVNNAGVLTASRMLSADGIELTFATNVLGAFLLTKMLAGLLARSAPSRTINVSSGGMYTQRLHVEDLQMASEKFDGPVAYARTKRIEVILTELWAERLAPEGVVVHAMHPGWVDTPGLASSLPRFQHLARPLLRTPRQGADTIVWLGAAPEPARSSGRFWHDRRARPIHYLPWTRESAEERERLWSECERLSHSATGPAPARHAGPTAP